jgi:putative glutamine transport system substrate-binding protein
MAHMKKSFLFLLIILFISFNSLANEENSALFQAQERDKLIIGVKTDVPLFGWEDPKTGVIDGFDIDIAKLLALHLLGDAQKLELKPVSPSSRLAFLQTAEVDLVIATTTITDERKQLVDFSESYFDLGQSLLVREHSNIREVKDLAYNNVLVVKGTVAIKILPKKIPAAKLLEYEDYASAIKALRAGKGVALVTSSAILLGIQKNNPDLHLVGGLFTFESFGIAVQKGDSVMQQAVNDVLRKIRASGEYNAIYQKWFGEIVEKEYDDFYQKSFGHLFKQ